MGEHRINGKNRPIPEGLRKMFQEAKDLSQPKAGPAPKSQFQIGVSSSQEHGIVLLDFSVAIKFVGFKKSQALEIAADLVAHANSLPDEPAEPAAETPPPGPANDGEKIP